MHGSKVGFTHQSLIISLAQRRCAILIVCTRINRVHQQITRTTQLELLTDVHSLRPKGFAVLLVDDREFVPLEVLRQVDHWGWGYVLR